MSCLTRCPEPRLNDWADWQSAEGHNWRWLLWKKLKPAAPTYDRQFAMLRKRKIEASFAVQWRIATGLTPRLRKLRGELLRLLDQFAYVSAALGRSVPFAGGPRQGNLVKIAHALKLRLTELLPEGEGNSSDPPLPTDVLSRSRDGVALARAFNCIKSPRFRRELVELAEMLADAEQQNR